MYKTARRRIERMLDMNLQILKMREIHQVFKYSFISADLKALLKNSRQYVINLDKPEKYEESESSSEIELENLDKERLKQEVKLSFDNVLIGK